MVNSNVDVPQDDPVLRRGPEMTFDGIVVSSICSVPDPGP